MDVSKYKTQLPYPSREDYTTRFWYKEGQCILELRSSEPLTEEDRALIKGAVMEKSVSPRYQEAKKAYHQDQARLTQDFYCDLAVHLGIEDNPKKTLLLSKAWERGHADGLAEVVAIAEDLVDLIL